jgi:hypothetical protein
MTPSASAAIDDYLLRLRSELDAAGASDTDDMVAEVRSLLEEAAGDDPEAASAEIDRLGEPAELARGILTERGVDPASGMPSAVWWRLGIAAPLDIAVGLAVPLAVTLLLLVVARTGTTSIVLTAAFLAVASLAWPFFIWRPYRRGGVPASPGMTLTGLAVVRTPGRWRLVPVGELEAMGLAPKRRVASAVLAVIIGVLVLAGAVFVVIDVFL